VFASIEATGERWFTVSHGISLSLLAAAASGVFLLALSQASAGNQPLQAAFAVRLITTPLVLSAALIRRPTTRPNAEQVISILGIGLLDAAATLLFALATTRGLMSLVSVIGSLYPITAIVLAQVFIREHLRSRQWFGICLAIVGVSLVALSPPLSSRTKKPRRPLKAPLVMRVPSSRPKSNGWRSGTGSVPAPHGSPLSSYLERRPPDSETDSFPSSLPLCPTTNRLVMTSEGTKRKLETRGLNMSESRA
jgi:uncharacterized membrane protein